ncbi:hypothetical protein ANCCAN_01903 [Ancylostoma caninum]|uniref:VWFA domain-containing protein n=1 Tax=Ancylostoma caninum TaxID=29170 RepID=A0A368H5E1_ANCCA|nr:hypothetical protein ANCCAN_01903 [Ancylostoma caninum]
MSEYFFESTDDDKSGARLWKYGYTDSFFLSIINAKESRDYFNENLENTLPEETDDHLNTPDAIETINERVKTNDIRVNSLIFISAQQNTSNLPQFEQKNCWKKVIAVGFNDADLSKVVEEVKGEAVSIPYNFSEHDARNFREEQLSSFGNPEFL